MRVSGYVELYTDELRYRDGQVDLRHDSADTLMHLVKGYLQRRFETRAVTVRSMAPVTFPATALRVVAQAEVNGKPGRFELDIQKGNNGWAVNNDTYSPLPVEPEAKHKVAVVEAQILPQINPASRIDRRQRFTLERLLLDPARYQHLQMRAHTERGGVAEGRFVGVDRDGNIAISRVLKGPGEAIYNLAPEDIARLELLEP